LATVGVAYASVAQQGVITITDLSTGDAAQLRIIRTDSDTNALLIDAVGGVGEPTTFNVAARSHNAIFSLRSIGGSPQIFLADDNDAANNNPQYRIRLSNDLGRLDFSYKEPPSAESIRMVITNTGNVGIGTVNPLEELDVNGDIRLSGANSKIISTGDICIGNCP